MAGKIKKLLENELVGGTQTTDVYPVTSTKAVYDENNERLDNIINKLDNSINKIEPGIIYDVSANNDGAVFESLQALLSSFSLNTLIPTSVRCGGMSIRFIQGSVPNSDNKYVQYRLTTSIWSTDIHDWTSEDPYFIDKIMQEVNEAIDEYTPIEIRGDVTNAPDEEDLASVNVGGTDVLKFKDKTYNPLIYSGMGRIILRKNIVSGVNTLTQTMINKSNTIYIIQYDFNLGEDITVPANCVLEFDGGSISGQHTLTGNNTGIRVGLVKIFNTNLTITGTWNVAEAYPEWFGAIGDGIIDDTMAINKIISSNISPNIVFIKHYAITETITISKAVSLKGYNTKGYYNLLENINNSKISTVNDIEIFVIATGGCNINGITFEGNGNSGTKSLVEVTASNNSISYCNFTKSYIGLSLQRSGINCISYNNFTQCSIGCKANYGGDNVFIGNYFNTNFNNKDFDNAGIGLLIQVAGNTSIIGGKVEYNERGIVVQESSGVIINSVQFDKNTYCHIFLNSTIISADSACRGTIINSCRFLGTRIENSQHIWINYWHDTTITCVGNSFAYSGSTGYDNSPANDTFVSAPSTIFNIKENHEYPDYLFKCKIYFNNNAIYWVKNLATTVAYNNKLIEFYTDTKLPVLGTGATFIGKDIYYKHEEVKSGVNIKIYKINGTVSVHIYGTATETFQNYGIYPEFAVTDGNLRILYDPNPGAWVNYISLIADTNKLLISLENGHNVDIYTIVVTPTSY